MLADVLPTSYEVGILTITTGLVDTRTTLLLLELLTGGRLEASGLITHRFGLPEMQEAYDVFAQAGQNKRSRSRSSRHDHNTDREHERRHRCLTTRLPNQRQAGSRSPRGT